MIGWWLCSWAMASPKPSSIEKVFSPLLDEPTLSSATISIWVEDGSSGKELFSFEADHWVAPASTAKLFTAAVVLDSLGPDFQFHTRIHGKISRDGHFSGIWIVGSGDPSLGIEDPDGLLKTWATAVADTGIRDVDDIVVDDRIFSWRPLGEAWTWDDGLWGYGAPISGINFGHNTTRLIVDKEGTTLSTNTGFFQACTQIESTLQLSAATDFAIDRPPFQPKISIWGSIAASDLPKSLTISIVDPPDCLGQVLSAYLKSQGVDVHGRIRRPHFGEAIPNEILTETTSEPISSLLYEMMKQSDNLYAESLLRASDTSKVGKTASGAWKSHEERFKSWGLDPNRWALLDGSGLSRKDRVTARDIVKLLAITEEQPWGDLFHHLLPIAGVDGTLKGRLKGTPAQENIVAKTGTLGQTHALVGWAKTRKGKKLRFAILIDDTSLPAKSIRELQDEVLLKLVKLP